MPPLIVAWQYALPFFAVFVLVFFPEAILTMRTGKNAGKQDAGSFPIVLVAQYFAMMAAFVIAFRIRSAALPHSRWWFWTGLGVMITGSLLRRHCIRTLGASFSTAVIVQRNQVIVERGAYRWIRHPSYTGGILIYIGLGIALGNWLALAELFVLVVASYSYRVFVEERALVETLGQPYRDYMGRTKRFIPLII